MGPPPESWVNDAVEQVGGGVAHADEYGRDQGDSQQQRYVGIEAGCRRRAAQAGVAEYILRQHRAAEQLCKGGELERQGGQEDIPKAVAPQQRPGALASGPGKEDVFRVQHVDELLPGVEGDVGKGHQAQGDGRQRQMVQPLAQGDIFLGNADGRGEARGEPLEPHREDQEQHQTQPEGGDGGNQVGNALQEPIRPFPLVDAHDAAQYEAEDAREDPGTEHQRQGVDESLTDDVQHRAAVEGGLAPVALEQLGEPVDVALHRRFIDTPVVLYLRPLLRRDGCTQPENILLYRVHRRQADQQKGHKTHCQQQRDDFDAVAQQRTPQAPQNFPMVKLLSYCFLLKIFHPRG